jgi:hypothetical protein
MMVVAAEDNWDPNFLETSPLFRPLQAVANTFVPLPHWPVLEDFVAAFQAAGLRVSPVAQGGRPGCFEQHYEPRIYLAGEVQTRLHNWHDFFNALVWLRFPQTKSVLNELHYFSALQRGEKTNRSALENAITLFDECGAIVVSSRADLLDMIRQHEWKKLFVDHRDSFESEIKCIVFGHAMYEKALNPYIGMTTNTLLIHSSELLQDDMQAMDAHLASCWKQQLIASTSKLRPLPVLGVPGWHVDNDNADFYDNQDYFRPRRNEE